MQSVEKFNAMNVNFWRINNEPTYMGGYLVDSGALVTAQLSTLYINEIVFKNPREFDPERFLRDEKLLQNVIPFELGKRSCLGESSARSELYLSIKCWLGGNGRRQLQQDFGFKNRQNHGYWHKIDTNRQKN
ncbi:hypothetical protein CRE_09250 [Caenorhabditis remanei]|uniref:Uncharacterized protein n=1 Tax=Caenorhabditis remanei TaxID=31234 RepID=E3LHR6_CAERE|nr:hypothetical protein CRE_09250 [Caenorhabditis remanei]